MTYELDYRIGDGSVQNIGRWSQIYDGSVTDIDIPLYFLDGKNVNFIFRVLSNGTGQDDMAFWLDPRIVR